jgi:hypothetical protein
MDINGRVIQVLPEQSGEGKNGIWKKQDFILETESQYPKKICITVWGDKIDSQMMQEGNQVNVSFDVESREYNGRWYTDVKAWKMEMAGEGQSSGGGFAPQPAPANQASAPAKLSEELKATGDDDLPF